MPTRRPGVGRKLTGTAVIAVSLLLGLAGLAVPAGAAYGPPPVTPPEPVPGGFTEVVTSQTVGDAGDDMTHLDLDGLDGSLDILPGTFRSNVQVTITEPFLRDSISATAFAPATVTSAPALHGACGSGTGIGDAGFRGYCAVGGAGIIVQINGVDDTHRFRKAMILTFDWKPRIHDIVVRWNGRHFVIVKKAVDQPRDARVNVWRDSDYLVLRRMPGQHHGVLSAWRASAMDRWLQALSTQVTPLFP